MDGNLFREQLKVVCRLYGGNKSVAQQAGVDNANLGKWLKGGATLSDANVARVLATLGFLHGKPDSSRVHVWTHGSALHDLSPAFALFFPKGAEIARAQWSEVGLKANLARLKKLPWVPELYAITDGHTRAILKLPTGLLIQKHQLGTKVRWKNGSENKSVLHIAEENLPVWLKAIPSISQFDQAWKDQPSTLSEKDVMQAIKDEGISLEVAISRIRRST